MFQAPSLKEVLIIIGVVIALALLAAAFYVTHTTVSGFANVTATEVLITDGVAVLVGLVGLATVAKAIS